LPLKIDRLARGRENNRSGPNRPHFAISRYQPNNPDK
jgi:hypothetical protein